MSCAFSTFMSEQVGMNIWGIFRGFYDTLLYCPSGLFSIDQSQSMKKWVFNRNLACGAVIRCKFVMM
jgi:hypothetical protein